MSLWHVAIQDLDQSVTFRVRSHLVSKHLDILADFLFIFLPPYLLNWLPFHEDSLDKIGK